MQHDIRVLRWKRNDLAIDRDFIAFFNARPELAHDLAVHANFAAPISSSAARLDATPACAKYFCNRTIAAVIAS